MRNLLKSNKLLNFLAIKKQNIHPQNKDKFR